MKRNLTLAMLAIASGLMLGGCGGGETKKASNAATAPNSQPAIPKGAPLPDSGFKAALTAVNPPATMNAGQQITIQVKLKNNSDTTWLGGGDSDGKYMIQIGNQWLDQNNKTVISDDGRTPIATDLKPGAEIELPLPIKAPTKAGSYILQLDLVQEMVAWSQDKGNPTFKVKVQVK
jgi:hypothetical protein